MDRAARGTALAAVLALALAPTGPARAQSLGAVDYLETRLRADSLAGRALWEEAEPLYRRLAERNPADESLWLRLARGYRALDRLPDAISALERAFELGWDRRARVAVWIAGYHAELGEREEALAWLERALADGLEDRGEITRSAAFEPYRDDPAFRALVGPPSGPTASRAEGWRRDLDWLVAEAERLHAAPDRPAHAPGFRAAADDLRRRIPELDDEGVALELQRLLASLGDGHTALWAVPSERLRFPALPVDLYWFEDGVFVVGGDAAAGELVGAELVGIGGVPVDALLRQVVPYVSRDNPMGVRARGPSVLRRTAFLRAVGAAADLDSARVELRMPDGTPRSLTLRAAGSRRAWRLRAPEGPGEPPLYLRRADENIWMTELPEREAVYVQFNEVSIDGRRIDAFADTLRATLEGTDARAVIVDVRHNGGGNNFLLWPLVRALIRYQAADPGRRIYVLAGRHTFSAAQNFVNRVRRFTGPTFVGEPTGSRPNMTGETTPVSLGFSGLRASVSSRHWQDSHPLDTRIWIAPDIPIPLDSRSYFRNRDPVLEGVLALLDRDAAARDAAGEAR